MSAVMNKFTCNHKYIAGFLISPLLGLSSIVSAAENTDLTDVSLEDLLKVEVTSVNRHSGSLANSAAAVYVVSNQDIRRSGATSIPEALRMVPGLHVAQIDSSRWDITARGTSGRYANKLLVMVDGRSIYTPAFSGVYWEQLDMVMEDIDRIEVIRGPGASLWGANAVNGVINIITKPASKTRGVYANVRAGTQTSGTTLRYGAKIDDSTDGRGYVKYRKNNSDLLPNGQNSYDAQHNEQAGFRVDKNLGEQGKLTLQGDIYDVATQQIVDTPSVTSPYLSRTPSIRKSNGWNILSRWEKPLSLTSDMTLQVYVDYYSIDELALFPQKSTTVDIDFQHHKTINDKHELTWGAGYYQSNNKIQPTSVGTSNNYNIEQNRISTFIQDEFSLIKNKLSLILGSKFEQNNVTGFEYQPNARMLWKPSEKQSVWASVSRSVRTPSMAEYNTHLYMETVPPDPNLAGLPIKVSVTNQGNFKSEESVAYEVGYRIQPQASLSFDSSFYSNHYNNTRVFVPPRTGQIMPDLITPVYIDTVFDVSNANNARSHGLELSTKWQALEKWRLEADYNYAVVRQKYLDGGSVPRDKFALRSSVDVTPDVDFDLWLRYVGKYYISDSIKVTLPDPVYHISGYWNMDVRLAWRPTQGVEFSLVGKNLLHSQQLESFTQLYNSQVVEIPRSIFGMAEWKF
jgi:iron complex outermembrane recepter protein